VNSLHPDNLVDGDSAGTSRVAPVISPAHRSTPEIAVDSAARARWKTRRGYMGRHREKSLPVRFNSRSEVALITLRRDA